MKKHNIFVTIFLWIYGQIIAAKIHLDSRGTLEAAKQIFSKIPENDTRLLRKSCRANALRIWIEACGEDHSLLRQLPKSDIAGMDVAIPAALARLEVVTDIKAVWQLWRDTTGVLKEEAFKHWQDLIDLKIMALPENDIAAAKKLLLICPPDSLQHDLVQKIVSGGRSQLDIVLDHQKGVREEYERRMGKFQRKNGGVQQLAQAA